jgi:DNA-binding PadR family transcriptional regulator
MSTRAQSAGLRRPLSPAMFHVMAALADGEKHGYAILKEVAEQTQDEVRLSAGTLYGIIKRLLAEGMIAECSERPAPELDDSRRRYYRLTDWGRQVAGAEAERMERLIVMARSKRLLKNLNSV